MKHTFQVENIRCGGCANTITKKLKSLSGVEDVKVNVEDKSVIVTAESTADANIHSIVSKKLLTLGYPEVGTEEANKLKTKATSFVSCAVGKVTSKS